MTVEIFSQKEFEAVLPNFTPLGLRQGNYAYLVNFGNPNARIMVYSSIAPDGASRGTRQDSIRAWLVTYPEEKPIGGKVQKYVKRTRSWRENLTKMIQKVAQLGRWIQPCPKCGKLIALTVKKGKEAAFAFCPTDADNRNNPNHVRHIGLAVISIDEDNYGELEKIMN